VHFGAPDKSKQSDSQSRIASRGLSLLFGVIFLDLLYLPSGVLLVHTPTLDPCGVISACLELTMRTVYSVSSLLLSLMR